MLKELQKQIEQKKKELIQPIKEIFEQIFQGYEITINFDPEQSIATASLQQKTETSLIILNFNLLEDEKLFTNYAVKYEIEHGTIIGVKASPFSIDLNVINYVFHELNKLLESTKEKEEEKEASEPQ